MAITTGTTVGINKWFTGPSIWLIYGILMKNGPGIVFLWKPKIQWISWIVYHSIKAPHEYQYYLVGGFNPSEKYSSSWSILPNIWKNTNHVPNHQSVIKYWYPDESWATWHHIFRHLQGACCACSPCTAIARSANSTARVSRKAATRPPAKSNHDWENGRKKIANMGFI